MASSTAATFTGDTSLLAIDVRSICPTPQAPADDEELLDYEEEEENEQGGGDQAAQKSGNDTGKKGSAIHATGFRDFLLKPELLRAIVDCGFEHPSEGK